MAGYSPNPLLKKLGIKPGYKLAIIQPPPGYLDILGPLPEGADWVDELEPESLDFLHYFSKSRVEFEDDLPTLKEALKMNGMLWVSWPKKASKVPTDLDGNIVRSMGLDIGLVDTKVCAVDEVWSGLKFMYRVKDRK